MKKILMAIVALVTFTASANAMSYEQARREALFLTDKMAYELNLNDSQYDAAYEINLDYLMGVTSVDDVYGTYWTRRNLDLSYILFDWQWAAFRAASYFYRPLYWNAGCWYFGIYARYPHRHYYYFSHPMVYVSYRGGHSWRSNGGRSYYHGHRDHFRGTVSHSGMRDRWDRGEIGHNNRRIGPNNDRRDNGLDRRRDNGFDRRENDRRVQSGTDRNIGNRNGSFRFDRNNGSDRNSSTRVTVRKQDEMRSNGSTQSWNNLQREMRSDRQNSFQQNRNRESGTPRSSMGSRNFNQSRSSMGNRNFNQSRSSIGSRSGNSSTSRGGSSFRQSSGGSRQAQTKRM